MASMIPASPVVTPAAFAAASSSVGAGDSTSVKAFSGLRSASLFTSKAQTLSAVQNGSRVQCMQVWNPIGMTKFETFSYLPPLSDEAIAKQVEYMIQQKLIPCLEFDLVRLLLELRVIYLKLCMFIFVYPFSSIRWLDLRVITKVEKTCDQCRFVGFNL